MLGGILRKLEPACLKGFLLFACKSLRDSEDEEAVFDFAEVNRRACAVALSGQVDSITDSARTRVARTLNQVFISLVFSVAL